MALYDSLPASVRVLFRGAPYDYDVQSAARQLENFTEQYGGGPTGRKLALEVIESHLGIVFSRDQAAFQKETSA
jgi:hypothetical protein